MADSKATTKQVVSGTKLESIGTVKTVIGTVKAVDQSGAERVLQAGDKVFTNETIVTAADGVVLIEFKDGSHLDLPQSTNITLDTDVFSPDVATGEELSADQIQELIAKGEDPTAITDATAAGGTSGDEGTSAIVDLGFNNAQGNVSSGFETAGIAPPVSTPPEALFITGNAVPAAVVSASTLPAGIVAVNTPVNETPGGENGKTHNNNGFGNGDQNAPGNSADNNNAENADGDKENNGKGSSQGNNGNSNNGGSENSNSNSNNGGSENSNSNSNNGGSENSNSNNGFGNGDQSAPGNSADNNNAENAASNSSSQSNTTDDHVDGVSLPGTTADDTLTGGAGNDTLSGDKGNDILTGGSGDDILSGGKGSDTFVWKSGDSGTDTVTDFTAGSKGDVLDLADLLTGEHVNANSLGHYLSFSSDGTNTTVTVNPDGVDGGATQTIVLQGVDLTAPSHGHTALSATEIINNLLTNGNLHTDA
jgi:Ca2+-binding RTX toxin-like protein